MIGFAKLDGRFGFDVPRLICEWFQEFEVFPSWAWVKHDSPFRCQLKGLKLATVLFIQMTFN